MKKYLFIVLLTGASLPCMAQLTFNTLQQVLEYADQKSADIQSSLLQGKKEQAKAKQTASYLYPQISGTASYNDNISIQSTLVPAQLLDPSAPEGSYQKLKFGKKYANEAGIQTQWDILDFQKIFATKTACNEVRLSQASARLTKFNVYKDISSIYYSILMMKEAITIYEENLQTSASALTKAEEKYNQGIINEETVNKARIQKLQADKKLTDARFSLHQLQCKLQSKLVTNEDIIINDNINRHSPQDSTNECMTTHPEIRYQESEVNLMQSQLKQARALSLPSISMVYQYNYDWVSDRFMDFSNASKMNSQLFGVKLSIPIFNGFYTKQKIREAKWSLKEQQLILESTRIAKQKEDDILLSQYHQTAQNLAKSQEMLALQKASDRHTEDKYNTGIINLGERLEKYQDLLDQQNSYLDNLSDYLSTEFQLYIRHLNF